MRWILQLALAAVIGALMSAAVTYSLVRETADPEAAPSIPSAEMVDSEHALQMCGTRGIDQAGEDSELKAAFETTAGEFADWTLGGPPDAPKGVNQFIQEELAVGRTMPIFVCYFDRETEYYPSVPPGYEGPPFNRIRVLVDKDGGSFTDAIGSQGNVDHPPMSIVRPGDGPH